MGQETSKLNEKKCEPYSIWEDDETTVCGLAVIESEMAYVSQKWSNLNFEIILLLKSP